MAEDAWKILSEGQNSGLVLAADFSNTGRPQAGFRDLAPQLNPSATVWETLPPSAGQVPSAGYVDWWLGAIRDGGWPIRAVLGYCAGAVFASEMSRHIATWQEEPLTILLDPEMPNVLGLYRDFHTVGDSMAGILSAEELREFHEVGQRVRTAGGEDIASVGSALNEVFKSAMATAATRLGLDDDIRDELAGVFGSLVEYLVAATQFDPRSIWARSVVVRSGRSAGGASTTQPLDTVITIDVEHHDLLRHDLTARAISDLLTNRPAP